MTEKTLVTLDELLGPIRPDTWWSRVRRLWFRWSPTMLRQEVRWGLQRWRRGYSDCDVWNFDHHLARIIPPAMRQLSHELHGAPEDIVQQYDDVETAVVEWRRILEAVAVGFEAWSKLDDEHPHPEGERLAELMGLWEEGSGLLIKHFGGFWD